MERKIATLTKMYVPIIYVGMSVGIAIALITSGCARAVGASSPPLLLSNETTEEHWVVVYHKDTGTIAYVMAHEDLDLLLLKAQSLSEEEGFQLIDNHPNLQDIVHGSTLYIFDLQENLVREMTPEEQAVYEEELRHEMLEDILRSIETLPDNRIRATLIWSTYAMYVETNSSVLGVKFDSGNKQLFIEVSGESGTSGALDLIVPQELVPSTDDVKVYLDSQPIEFTLAQVENNYYSVHAEYTHSLRTLRVNLIALPAWYAQPLNLALLALAVVIVIGAAYWFKFRR